MIEFPALKIGDLVSRVPVIQGGMGIGISLSGLASAVANEGGVGVISAVLPGIDETDFSTNSRKSNIRILKQEIRKARELTKGILGVNIMVALTDYGDMVKTSLEEGVDIIFSGAGLPLDLPGYLKKGMKTKLVPIVSSGRAATILCKKWLAKFNYLPDAFVVEGPAAGGHLGFKPDDLENSKFKLEHLVKDVVQAVKLFETKLKARIPVIAAGGIFSGRDIYKFLKMGASGVQMGTRFVATHECDADKAFKQALIDAGKEDLVVIKSPVGLPGRAVHNTFIDDVESGKKKPFKCVYHCLKTCDHTKSTYCIAMALASARKGKLNKGFAFAGKNAYRLKEIVSVKELFRSLLQEFNRT
jgi:nitronate monooxygenase